MGDITHFFNKTAYNFAKILPEIGFFYTNIVCTFVLFFASLGKRTKEGGQGGECQYCSRAWHSAVMAILSIFVCILLLSSTPLNVYKDVFGF